MRSLLSRIVVPLLACQLAAILSAPLTWCCLAAAGLDSCCAGMEPGDACPLHARAATHERLAESSGTDGPDASTLRCRMSAPCAQPDLDLLSLTAFAGLEVARVSLSVIPRVASFDERIGPRPISRPAPPPAPPPRA